MTRSKPSVKALSELTPSDDVVDCFVLLSDKTRGETQGGKPYYQCRFRDNRRSVTSMIWSDADLFDACEREWERGQFYKVRCIYHEHERYGPQITIADLRPIESDNEPEFNPAQLVESSRFDPDEMLAELMEIATEHVADEPLRRLVLTLLERHAEALKRLPATQNKFHPFLGGLLEHVLSVTKNCLFLIERYSAYYNELSPPLNKDLVIAGAILHDVGRVREFGDDPLGCEQTVSGRMLGHLILGRDLVRDAAMEQGDVPPELLQLLEHVIVTHLTLPAWGSPRLPLIPEVLILHHADDLDAKLEMYVRCLSRDSAPGAFTDRDPVLNRQLYKGRKL